MDQNDLAIMVAATSDPEFKDRLAKLREEQIKIGAQREVLQEDINKNAVLIQAARAEKMRAEAILAAAEQHEAAARADLDNAARAFKAVQDEEARFEAGRATVDQQQDDREAVLKIREAKCDAREKAIDQYLNRMAEREEAVTQLEQRHAAASRHAAAFRAALGDKST